MQVFQKQAPVFRQPRTLMLSLAPVSWLQEMDLAAYRAERDDPRDGVRDEPAFLRQRFERRRGECAQEDDERRGQRKFRKGERSEREGGDDARSNGRPCRALHAQRRGGRETPDVLTRSGATLFVME